MKPKGKLLLILFLITWASFAVVTFTNHSQNYLFKSYFDSDYFQSNHEQFISQLGDYVLTPFDPEAAKEKISVTQGEIDYYRNYYGTLPEQVENIRVQYSDQIMQAEENQDASLKKILVNERDAKITDIKKNFESDEYVEEKILKQKEKAIDQYAADEASLYQQFRDDFTYYTYDFVNVDTGEEFTFGTPNNDVYIENFDEQETALLTVDNTVSFNLLDADAAYSPEGMLRIDGDVSRFEGSISIPKAMMKNTNFADEYNQYKMAQTIFYILWITGILVIFSLFTVAKPSKALFEGPAKLREIFDRFPIDVRLLLIIIAAFISFAIMERTGNMIENLFYFGQDMRVYEFSTQILMMYVGVSAVVLGIAWIWQHLTREELFRKELKSAMLYRLADGMQDVFLNRSFGIQATAIIVIAFLAGIGFVGAAMSGELLIIYVVLLFFIALPAFLIFLSQTGYMNRIMKQTKDMAEGRLTSEIKVKRRSLFAEHAKNLNALREGVRTSMTEQAKSERLKTELITNVSHDLRTPLTSIITYTDLLKNPNLTEEERAQYIDVLDKKSIRLKTLIEDLFEVSKMASGNIELSKQQVDLTQLMQQALGEHKEAIAKAQLDLRVTMPEQPIYAVVDGQKIWRVIDNLIVNALKYSLEGTRVYVVLKQQGSSAEFTVKNVSKFELNDNVEELTERFKRADASRHTDGSGLGLAIAQSIVDLHNGRMAIEVDGDLFKVTVLIPTE